MKKCSCPVLHLCECETPEIIITCKICESEISEKTYRLNDGLCDDCDAHRADGEDIMDAAKREMED